MKVIDSTQVEVPAGVYVMGDPCYSIPYETPDGRNPWLGLLHSCDFFQDKPVGSVSVDGKEVKVAAFGTAYGDGYYAADVIDRAKIETDDSVYFPVDAGLIGLVPFDAYGHVPKGCVKVTLTENTRFFVTEDNEICLSGVLTVPTAGTDDGCEYDEDEDEDEDENEE